MKLIRPLILSAILGGYTLAAQAAEFKVDLIAQDPWAAASPGQGENTPFTGIIVDLLKEFEKRSGHQIKPRLTPSIRAERDLQNGEVDFSIIEQNQEHDQYALRGVMLFPLHIGIRAKKGVSIIRYDDLKKITTSVNSGLKVERDFDADQSLKKDFVKDYITGVKKTAANRDSQAIAGSLSTINYTIKKLGLTDQFGDTFLFGTTRLTVYFSKKSAKSAYAKEVNTIFKSMLDDGTVRQIHSKWMD
ncbi:MAG: substrate-binding periplasmic protein [Iodobacter sp.]